MTAWSRKTLKKNFTFLRFCRKTTSCGKIFKTLFRKYSLRHRSTCCVQISWNLANGKWEKSCVAYLPKKNKKFRLSFQLSLLHWSCPESARVSTRQCTQSALDFIQIGSLSAELGPYPNARTPSVNDIESPNQIITAAKSVKLQTRCTLRTIVVENNGPEVENIHSVGNGDHVFYWVNIGTLLIMVALCNRADHYIFALWLLSFYLFYFLA